MELGRRLQLDDVLEYTYNLIITGNVPQGRIKALTASDYFEICKICYAAIGLCENVADIDAETLYRRASAIDSVKNMLKYNTPETFAEYIVNRYAIHEHAYEIIFGIELWCMLDEGGYYFYLYHHDCCGVNDDNCAMLIMIYNALISNNIPVTCSCCDVEEVISDIISFIPSKTVQNYLKQNGHSFNDEEKATIVCNIVQDKKTRNDILSTFYGIKRKDIKRLEDNYVVIPHPFERGDIVRVGTSFGVVEGTQECFKRTVESFNNGAGLDWFDVCVGVQLLDEEGFCETPICTLVLEKATLGELMNYRWKSLLMATQRLFRGEGMLDTFLGEYERFKKAQSNNA